MKVRKGNVTMSLDWWQYQRLIEFINQQALGNDNAILADEYAALQFIENGCHR